jgi:hypothetical protein
MLRAAFAAAKTLEQREEMMYRGTLTTIATLCLAAVFATALPQAGLAQSNAWLGIWKLNPAKSNYPTGQAPRSSTYNYKLDGANLTNTVETVDAAGNTTKTLNPHIYDGQAHPITGNANVDTRMYAKPDANTVISASMKGGKLVQVTTIVLSQDGKTITTTTRGTDAKGQQLNSVAVYDKQ